MERTLTPDEVRGLLSAVGFMSLCSDPPLVNQAHYDSAYEKLQRGDLSFTESERKAVIESATLDLKHTDETHRETMRSILRKLCPEGK